MGILGKVLHPRLTRSNDTSEHETPEGGRGRDEEDSFHGFEAYPVEKRVLGKVVCARVDDCGGVVVVWA